MYFFKNSFLNEEANKSEELIASQTSEIVKQNESEVLKEDVDIKSIEKETASEQIVEKNEEVTVEQKNNDMPIENVIMESNEIINNKLCDEEDYDEGEIKEKSKSPS